MCFENQLSQWSQRGKLLFQNITMKAGFEIARVGFFFIFCLFFDVDEEASFLILSPYTCLVSRRPSPYPEKRRCDYLHSSVHTQSWKNRFQSLSTEFLLWHKFRRDRRQHYFYVRRTFETKVWLNSFDYFDKQVKSESKVRVLAMLLMLLFLLAASTFRKSSIVFLRATTLLEQIHKEAWYGARFAVKTHEVKWD